MQEGRRGTRAPRQSALTMIVLRSSSSFCDRRQQDDDGDSLVLCHGVFSLSFFACFLCFRSSCLLVSASSSLVEALSLLFSCAQTCP